MATDNGHEPATKADLVALEQRLTGDIGALEKRLTGDIGVLEKRLTGDIGALEKRVTGDIAALEKRVTGDIAALELRLTQNLTEAFTEAFRDNETHLLKAFYGFTESVQARFKASEDGEANMKNRLAAIEQRLIEVEKRLNMPGQ